METKEYRLNIDPRILELLGPSLYTNIYYIIAELIANAYDADAHNVYIIDSEDKITVEDDGNGMSYAGGDIDKYLNVARVSRNSEDDAETALGRKKMGRKGVGKLAALSVSENVLVKTMVNDEKSGFVLSRTVKEDRLLQSLDESDINFEKITQHGTAIVMLNPQYQLHATVKAIRRNLLKLFPMVSEDFKIHIIRGKEEAVISNFDKDMIKELASLITLGDDFKYLTDIFETEYPDLKSELCNSRQAIKIPLQMNNKEGKNQPVTVRQVIGNLPPIAAGEKNYSDNLHVTATLSDINIQRIQHSIPGGTWRDWPESLVLDCHKKDSGQTYSAVYGRMRWDDVAPTITTQFIGYGTGRFGHPEQDRALTLREGAMLQTFPRGYSFVPQGETVVLKNIARHIGNAVPPRLGEVIGLSIKSHCETKRKYVKKS